GHMDLRLLGLGTITVHVRAADTTTVIPGARVDVAQVGQPLKKVSFQADAQGNITVDGADAFSEGDFVVLAPDLRNAPTGRAHGTIKTDGQAITLNVYLLSASGVVFGRVLRPDGATPVPNAEVVITSGSDAVGFATTDADGRYREVGIPLGSIKVDIFEA